MNIEKDKYIILELIPSHSKSEFGEIIQLQALKLEGLKLISRFDYRLDENKIDNKDLKDIVSYDKESFKYVSSSKKILNEFKKFSDGLPLLIIDNDYTKDYLKTLTNSKESIFKYLNLDMSDDVFSKIISKYKLEPSNHFVDLLYEALIKESNNNSL
ncbi:MAG: hypothetical protein IJ501_02025 [Bacilli bacterium]|nr:hypothetical protein [Bacilli bacterium]